MLTQDVRTIAFCADPSNNGKMRVPSRRDGR